MSGETTGQHAAHDELGSLAEELRALGAETVTERRVKRTVPWVFSLMVHSGVFLLAIVLAGTVRLIQRDEAPLIVADFDAMSYDPVRTLEATPDDPVQEVAQDRVELESMEDLLDQQLLELEADPLAILSEAAADATLAEFAPQPVASTTTFVGLRTSNARRIVYVIDASGSLIATLQVVIDELRRSLDTLTYQQEFAVVFFQQDRALALPPAGRLVTASEAEKSRALAWIRQTVIPNGNSNPLPALETALRMKPDVIFLLSDKITGAGQYQIDRGDLLAALDRLNPRDARNGRRRTQINCIQFLDPDPLDTLAMIAREHGGPEGYKFLDRQELGLTRP